MTQDEAHTWHYGLVARYWAEHKTTGPEIAYFADQIRRYGGPVLDAGCGTGRLLIPFLEAGIDVDGCDVSQDMLQLCREKAEQKGFTPRLHHQALHELDLPRTYQTIVVCGAFGLGVGREQDRRALERLHVHLDAGGVLLMDQYLPYGDEKTWRLWPSAARQDLPEPWPESVGTVAPAEGSGFELHMRILAFDPVEQQATRQMRILRWRDARVAEEQTYTLTENFYFRRELQQMLEHAGFVVDAVHGPHIATAATPDDAVIVIVARKAPRM